MDSPPRRRRTGLYLALAVVFFAPALTRSAQLVEAGTLRWVDALTIFVGGLAAGGLLIRGLLARAE